MTLDDILCDRGLQGSPGYVNPHVLYAQVQLTRTGLLLTLRVLTFRFLDPVHYVTLVLHEKFIQALFLNLDRNDSKLALALAFLIYSPQPDM